MDSPIMSPMKLSKNKSSYLKGGLGGGLRGRHGGGLQRGLQTGLGGGLAFVSSSGQLRSMSGLVDLDIQVYCTLKAARF